MLNIKKNDKRNVIKNHTFKNFHNGLALSPLTSIFSNRSNFTLRSAAKQTISSELPGSSPAN